MNAPRWTILLTRSQYGTSTPTARIHNAESDRAASAALHRLAAAVEDRSDGYGWAVQVGDGRVTLELATDFNTEALDGLAVLRASVQEVRP